MGIILFDGTCMFCERSVRFIASRDSRAYFKFGASQSPQAQALLTSFGVEPASARSIVLIEGGRVYTKSDASLRIAGRLTAPWHLAAWLLWIPRPVRDAVYKVVATARHRLAGRSNACEIPPPEIRSRLI
ncbi:MAG: DCC1-like thiol-disulfide oxidoreductase family protein [Vicinamibacterales bacterium]